MSKEEKTCEDCIHWYMCNIYSEIGELQDERDFYKENKAAWEFLPTICKFYNKKCNMHYGDNE